MRKSIAVMIFGLSASACYATSGGITFTAGAQSPGEYKNVHSGGDGLPGQHGQRGMAGCPGATMPSQDGRYYLPGTHEQCNPAHAKSHPKRHRITPSVSIERV